MFVKFGVVQIRSPCRVHQEVGERAWHFRKFRRGLEYPIEAMNVFNFFSNNLCVFLLLDQSDETSRGLEWQTPVAPLMMKSCNAAISGFTKRFPVRSYTSDKIYLMSLAHRDWEERGLATWEGPGKLPIIWVWEIT